MRWLLLLFLFAAIAVAAVMICGPPAMASDWFNDYMICMIIDGQLGTSETPACPPAASQVVCDPGSCRVAGVVVKSIKEQTIYRKHAGKTTPRLVLLCFRS